MNKEKIYLNIVGILVVLLIALGCFVFRYNNIFIDKKAELSNIQLKNKNYDYEDKYGYTDILNNFKGLESINVKKISEKNDKNIVYVQTEVRVDKSKIYEVLNTISKGDNVKNIDSIKVQQCEDNMLLLDLNMGFLKNK